MTDNNKVASAWAAMPCVPLPPPKPALDHLPAEIITNIVRFIPGSPIPVLFALRRTNRFYRSVAAELLRPHMKTKLKSIRVLMTEEGLTTLLDIMSVQHWRSCIQCVEFIDPGVDAIVKKTNGKRGIYHRRSLNISSAPFQAIQNKVRPTYRTECDLGERAPPASRIARYHIMLTNFSLHQPSTYSGLNRRRPF
jgi:hypothetical protein